MLTLWGGTQASVLLKASGETSVELGLRTTARGHSVRHWLQAQGFRQLKNLEHSLHRTVRSARETKCKRDHLVI